MLILDWCMKPVFTIRKRSFQGWNFSYFFNLRKNCFTYECNVLFIICPIFSCRYAIPLYLINIYETSSVYAYGVSQKKFFEFLQYLVGSRLHILKAIKYKSNMINKVTLLKSCVTSLIFLSLSFLIEHFYLFFGGILELRSRQLFSTNYNRTNPPHILSL